MGGEPLGSEGVKTKLHEEILHKVCIMLGALTWCLKHLGPASLQVDRIILIVLKITNCR